jgi:hypothetical protein
MRDILNLIENLLNETSGLSGREPGERYVKTGSDDPNDFITFKALTFFPEVGGYDSLEQTQKAFAAVQKKVKTPITILAQPQSTMRAFGLAEFETPKGPWYLVKFAKDIKPVRTANKFLQTTDIPGSWTYDTGRAKKETVGYKPSQVLTDQKSQTPASIVAQITKKFGKKSYEAKAAAIFSQATAFPIVIPAGNMQFEAFRDYFTEMLQPIALINNMPVKGNAYEAAKIFLKGNYTNCVTSFNPNPGGTLYDSLLINPKGKQIKLSSKGAKGAVASSVNLLKAVQELEAAGMPQFAQEYADVIRILKIIDQQGHAEAALTLATDYKLINPKEAEVVLSMKPMPLQGFDINKVPGMTKNLKKFYEGRKAQDPNKIIPMNHLVASIAYTVANLINTKTNFSDAAADILNHSAFVQMYTEAKNDKKTGTFVITGFTSVWPSKLFTEVAITATKSYSSSKSSKGSLNFDINKQPKAVPNVDQSTDAMEEAEETELQTDHGIIPSNEPVYLGTEKTLGRKRQP